MEQDDRQINVGPVIQNRYSELFQREENLFLPPVSFTIYSWEKAGAWWLCVYCSKLLLIITLGLFSLFFLD